MQQTNSFIIKKKLIIIIIIIVLRDLSFSSRESQMRNDLPLLYLLFSRSMFIFCGYLSSSIFKILFM